MSNGLLLHNAGVVVTMDAARRGLRGGWVHMLGGAIAAVGDATTPPPTSAESIDLAGLVLMPGLVNTHHHMFKSLARALPGAQDAELFDWLSALYAVWSRLTPEALRIAATTATAELVLSGLTTAADTTTAFRTAAAWTTRSRSQRPSGFVSTRRAVPCASAGHKAACRPTRWWSGRRRSAPTWNAW